MWLVGELEYINVLLTNMKLVLVLLNTQSAHDRIQHPFEPSFYIVWQKEIVDMIVIPRVLTNKIFGQVVPYLKYVHLQPPQEN